MFSKAELQNLVNSYYYDGISCRVGVTPSELKYLRDKEFKVGHTTFKGEKDHMEVNLKSPAIAKAAIDMLARVGDFKQISL